MESKNQFKENNDRNKDTEEDRVAGLLKPTIPLYNIAGNHDVGNVPISTMSYNVLSVRLLPSFSTHEI